MVAFGRGGWKPFVRVLGVLAILAAGGSGAENARDPHPAQPNLLLATTTTLGDSGLLRALIRGFQAQTGYRVTALTGSAARAVALTQQGEVDALLVMVDAHPVVQNRINPTDGLAGPVVLTDDFVLVGPAADPAHLAHLPLLAALRTIAATGTTWVSRHDGSDANGFELTLWDQAMGRDVQYEGWYISTHQDGDPTLREADRRQAYTLSTGAGYRAAQRRLHLQALITDDPLLSNPYQAITVSRQRRPQANLAGAYTWVAYLESPAGQGIIAAFGAAQYGQALFQPAPGAAP